MSTAPEQPAAPPPAGPAPNRKRNLILGIVGGLACLGLLAAVVIGLIGFALFRAQPSDPVSGRAPMPDGSQTAPPGVADDQPYLELSTATDGPVVDVYLDFLCPHCATFAESNGSDLQELAETGTITLRVHPRPMLDANSSPAGYSGRAANAAVCAYAEDPALWFPVEAALFDEQPGAEGLTDQELTEVVTDAGASDAVGECITAGTYLPWIQDVVEPQARESTQGTPTVLIDGVQYTGTLDTPGALREAIEAA
ncbi:MAG: hypothetical protein DI611_13390 [Brachybacterium faecium]|nr:MAG: hypothetical protein DI611_13390 [Brachybacterium faecium]